jgi:DNA-binding NtrC family response regulator
MSEFSEEDDNNHSNNNRLESIDTLNSADEVGPLAHSDSADLGQENKVEGSNFRTLRQQEKDYLLQLIKKSGGDKKAAAKIAGITLRTLYRKLEE